MTTWLLLLLGLLLPVGIVADATESGVEKASSTVTAVWLADREQLVALDPVTNVVVQRLAKVAGTRTLAMDGTRGVVWAYGKGRLSSYRIDGTLL
ncbi:MAG: hypothetical protein H7833_05670, partial [Magnetococcus sp. DMHC-1]